MSLCDCVCFIWLNAYASPNINSIRVRRAINYSFVALHIGMHGGATRGSLTVINETLDEPRRDTFVVELIMISYLQKERRTRRGRDILLINNDD